MKNLYVYYVNMIYRYHYDVALTFVSLLSILNDLFHSLSLEI